MLSESPQLNYLVISYVAPPRDEYTCISDVDKRKILQKWSNDAVSSLSLTLKINNMGSKKQLLHAVKPGLPLALERWSVYTWFDFLGHLIWHSTDPDRHRPILVKKWNIPKY